MHEKFFLLPHSGKAVIYMLKEGAIQIATNKKQTLVMRYTATVTNDDVFG